MSWRHLASGLGAALALAGLAACTGDASENAAPSDTAPVIVPGRPGEPASTIPPGQATPPPSTPPNATDVQFVQNMIVHHQQALDMANLVPQRSARDDVKRFADRVLDSQRVEIDAMNDWLRRHGHPTIDPEHGGHGQHAGMPGMATPAQLDTLRAASGPEFDRLFLQLMITHHEGALTMAGQAQTHGRDVRVQELADDVIVGQTDEINTMRAMLGG